MRASEIKEFCKSQSLSYKDLSKFLGMSEGSLKVALTTDKISSQTASAFNLLKENLALKKELEKTKALKELLKEWILN